MQIEVLELRPVDRPGGLVFTATVRLGEIAIRGWRGVLWNGQLCIGPPQRTFWDGGQRFHEALLDVPPLILEQATTAILAAWAERGRVGSGMGNGGRDRNDGAARR